MTGQTYMQIPPAPSRGRNCQQEEEHLSGMIDGTQAISFFSNVYAFLWLETIDAGLLLNQSKAEAKYVISWWTKRQTHVSILRITGTSSLPVVSALLVQWASAGATSTCSTKTNPAIYLSSKFYQAYGGRQWGWSTAFWSRSQSCVCVPGRGVKSTGGRVVDMICM